MRKKVKIVSSENNNLWYADMVGSEYLITMGSNEDVYKLVNSLGFHYKNGERRGEGYGILKEDCEVVDSMVYPVKRVRKFRL